MIFFFSKQPNHGIDFHYHEITKTIVVQVANVKEKQKGDRRLLLAFLERLHGRRNIYNLSPVSKPSSQKPSATSYNKRQHHHAINGKVYPQSKKGDQYQQEQVKHQYHQSPCYLHRLSVVDDVAAAAARRRRPSAPALMFSSRQLSKLVAHLEI
jgi:hypothetical protein